MLSFGNRRDFPSPSPAGRRCCPTARCSGRGGGAAPTGGFGLPFSRVTIRWPAPLTAGTLGRLRTRDEWPARRRAEHRGLPCGSGSRSRACACRQGHWLSSILVPRLRLRVELGPCVWVGRDQQPDRCGTGGGTPCNRAGCRRTRPWGTKHYARRKREVDCRTRCRTRTRPMMPHAPGRASRRALRGWAPSARLLLSDQDPARPCWSRTAQPRAAAVARRSGRANWCAGLPLPRVTNRWPAPLTAFTLAGRGDHGLGLHIAGRPRARALQWHC